MIPELRRIYSAYGTVLSVTCKKKISLRGQAFIVFSDVAEAVRALQALQTRTIYGKSMVIRFARRPSNISLKKQGGSKLLRQERVARKADKLERARYPRLTKRQRLAHAMASGIIPVAPMMPAGQPLMSSASQAVLELPNKTVFVQGLPADASDSELIDMFKRYIGFVEFRRIPNQPEIGFVEYESEAQAGVVRNALDRHELRPGRPIRVTFARR
jgi:RNA recognition motif-containing protein